MATHCPQILTPTLSELTGAMLGDGCLAARKHCVMMCGHQKLDRDYYKEFIVPTFQQLFGVTLAWYDHPNTNSMYVRTYDEDIHSFFRHVLGVPQTKTYDGTIPPDILLEGYPYTAACVRGLFDTDGCVFFDRREVYDRPYIRLSYTSASEQLVHGVSDVLDALGVQHTTREKKNVSAFEIQINGYENVGRYVELIGFSNPRHTEKLEVLDTG